MNERKLGAPITIHVAALSCDMGQACGFVINLSLYNLFLDYVSSIRRTVIVQSEIYWDISFFGKL